MIISKKRNLIFYCDFEKRIDIDLIYTLFYLLKLDFNFLR